MQKFTKKAANALKLAAKAARRRGTAISVPNIFCWDFWRNRREQQPRSLWEPAWKKRSWKV